MKKRYFLAIMLTLMSTGIFAQADDIIGTWLTADKEAHVEIYKTQNIYYGKIIWLKNANDPATRKPWLDKENKNTAQRTLPLLGSKMLWGFQYKKGEYTNGKVYDSRDGATYSGKLWLTNKDSLKMRGYWGIFFSTAVWTRVKS